MSTYREADKQIPIAVRLRMEERAGLSDVQNTYVYSMTSNQRVPLSQVSNVTTEMAVPKIKRRNQFRTVTVSAFPIPGVLPSQVLTPLLPKIKEFQKNLPPGYFLEIGGEYDEQQKGFKELSVVMAISVAAHLHCVGSAVPKCGQAASRVCCNSVRNDRSARGSGDHGPAVRIYGVPGSRESCRRHRQPRHRAVRLHRRSTRTRRAVARGAARCRHRATRPVMITVGATVLGLVPLAMHGGPLWEPLCYAQIGGLTIATFVTLLLVPVLYSIFVLDLKLIKWETVVPVESEVPVHAVHAD